jgi:hypothetical protein
MTAADPEGRVRHLLDVMHKTFDAAGDPIAAGMVPIADGLGQVDYVDSSTFGGGLPWFIVTAYGAVGDGSTDDRTAINAAIAALNSAGGGVLYFPATPASYFVSDALTALTVPCLVLGDGKGISQGGSSITTNHATAKLFTVSDLFIEFRGLAMKCTATTPASGGAGIATTTGHGTVCSYIDLWIEGFYDCMALQHGGRWIGDGLQIINPSRYGIWIANTDLPDGGDWSISNSEITTSSAATHTPTSAIRQDSAGGGKVVNVKINGDTSHEFVTGYDLNINGSANKTSVLTLSSNSIENVSGDAISISTTGTGAFGLIAISGLQSGLYSNNTGRVVKINAATNGAYPANGSIGIVTLDGISAHTDGTARAAISLTNTDLVTLGDMALSGFNARYTSSGDTNTVDSGATVAYATPAIVLGTAAAAGAAASVIRSDSTIVAFDATVPTTIAFSDAAATGSAAIAARRDHRHGAPANPGGFGPLLIADTHSTPIVFGDVILNEAQDDFLYADT